MKRGALSWRVRGQVMAECYDRHSKRFICSWCCARLTADEVVIDHIDAVANGGTNDTENLCVSCRKCNAQKAAKPKDVAEFEINERLEMEAAQ